MLNFCDFIQVFVFTTNHHLHFGLDFIKMNILIKFLAGHGRI